MCHIFGSSLNSDLAAYMRLFCVVSPHPMFSALSLVFSMTWKGRASFLGPGRRKSRMILEGKEMARARSGL